MKQIYIICGHPFSYSSALSKHFTELGFETGKHEQVFKEYKKYEDIQLCNFVNDILFENKKPTLDFSLYNFKKPVILKYPHACLTLQEINYECIKNNIELKVIYPFRNTFDVIMSMHKRKLNLLGQKNNIELYELFSKGLNLWQGILYVANMNLIMKTNKYKYVPIRMDINIYQRIKSIIDKTYIGKELDDKKTISSWIRDAIKEKLKKGE